MDIKIIGDESVLDGYAFYTTEKGYLYYLKISDKLETVTILDQLSLFENEARQCFKIIVKDKVTTVVFTGNAEEMTGMTNGALYSMAKDNIYTFVRMKILNFERGGNGNVNV